MPERVKTNKITLSDMETPQERNKEPTHKGKLSNAQ
jgi:hypothetical protein